MLEDLKEHRNGKFITLTFSNDSIAQLTNYIAEKNEGILPEGYELDNAIATTAMRLFNERWRKKYKRAIRHWMVTELGHNGTENIHLHGIVWTNQTYTEIESHWQYGHIWPTKDWQTKAYVNEATVNYITKYVTKKDELHTTYRAIILTSPGIGSNYTKGYDHRNNKFKDRDTIETYTTRTGHEMSLPIYWRNKIYTEQQREKLWLYRLDKNERWVCGEKVKADDDKEYWGLVKYYRRQNLKLGYGTNEKDWNREQYEKQRRKIMQQTRIQNATTAKTRIHKSNTGKPGKQTIQKQNGKTTTFRIHKTIPKNRQRNTRGNWPSAGS